MTREQKSRLGRAYVSVYDALCGRHPHLLPWHYQWLDGFYFYRALRRRLPELTGKVLDVGCGEKPYEAWFGETEEYIGVDVVPGPAVDIVIRPEQRWPFEDERFDVVIATQTIEHVEDLATTLNEIARVLKSGGTVILTFPFLYNEHGAPYDFRRLTVHLAWRLFPGFAMTRIEREGGIGSTIAILLLNWIEYSLNLTFATRLLKAPLLPAWILASLVANVLGLLIDRIDRTDSFYNNIYVEFKKPARSSGTSVAP